MKAFRLHNGFQAVCEWKKTRLAFKHEATVIDQYGNAVYRTKICYQNRTWESFDYQSVAHKAINGYFKDQEAEDNIKLVDQQGRVGAVGALGALKKVCAMGELLGSTTAEKNIWKKRMLSTVPGIEFPDGFDALQEQEKAKRLNEAVNVL